MNRKSLIVTVIILILVLGWVSYTIASSPEYKKRWDKFSLYINQRTSLFLMYQNLANPFVRHVRIPAGLRKEQIAAIYTKNLNWGEEDVDKFLHIENTESNLEGYYFPSTYIIPKTASGESVRQEMFTRFNQKAVTKIRNNRYILNKDLININTALKVASLIQREAAGKHDMNLVSGIIWNRIWNGMSLEIDATLQYAKGNEVNGWWPIVKAEDKKINSPYNTYKNKGLPPSPIANPSLDALEAAYNPELTNCIFYLHDRNRNIHCSVTYEEHKRLVEQYLR
jgi:UPF0755 protein